MIPLQCQSSDIHNHPVMELSAEKFWAFPGKKSKENFKCVCFVFQKCHEKKKVRAKEGIRSWNCANPPPAAAGRDPSALCSHPSPRVPRSCCNPLQISSASHFSTPAPIKAVILYPISLLQSKRHKQIPVSIGMMAAKCHRKKTGFHS